MQSAFYNVRSGQTIYDIAMQLYGSLDAIVRLVDLNPQVGSLDFDYVSNPNQVLEYDAEVIPVKPAGLVLKSLAVSTTGLLRARDGQSAYDLCLMSYGTLDKLITVIQDAQISSTDEVMISGKSFTWALEDSKDKILSNVIARFGYIFSTQYRDDEVIPVIARITEAFVLRITESGIQRIAE